MFYYLDKTDIMTGVVQRHILSYMHDGGVRSWPLTDDNPNKPAYDAWIAEGNTPEPWNPE